MRRPYICIVHHKPVECVLQRTRRRARRGQIPVFRQTKGAAEERSESRSFRIIPLTCASLTIALGLLTFIGWISGVPLLASVGAKYIPIAPSTAFCFTLIGVGLIAHVLKAALRWIPRFVASVVLAVVCAKLVGIFGDLNFGIDPPAQEFFDRVISDVRQFSERKSFDDDVCVVVMEVQHTG
jgi:uncharacterized membrane protein YraQ (UPF0718 family)